MPASVEVCFYMYNIVCTAACSQVGVTFDLYIINLLSSLGTDVCMSVSPLPDGGHASICMYSV